MKATVNDDIIWIDNNPVSSISDLKKADNVIIEKDQEHGYNVIIDNDIYHVESGYKCFCGFKTRVLFAF